jgi:DNA-binding NtrC family response regulator
MVPSRILIIDDEENICTMLADFLEDRGYETFQANTGEDAMRLIKEARPHLILLDIRMPEMSGVDMLGRIRQVDREVVIIMITAYHDIDIAQQALKNGASDFITKPIDLDYLATSIQHKLQAMLA